MSCGRKGFKALLIAFNILFWLGGGTLLGIGIWMLVDPTMVNNFSLVDLSMEEEGSTSEGETDPLVRYAAVIFIVVGSVAFLVGLAGFCGAHNEHRTLLCTYALMLIFIMIVEVSAATLVIVYKSKVGPTVRGPMLKHLQQKYSQNVKTYYTKWNQLQQVMKCCGVNNHTDFRGSLWWNTSRGISDTVPLTCCVRDDAKEYVDKEACMKAGGQLDTSSVKQYIHTKGCYEALETWFHTHMLVISILALLVVTLEVFGVLAALCLRSAVSTDCSSSSSD